MKEYKENVRKVMDFLDQNHYCQSAIKGAGSCYRALELFLIQEQAAYSPETAQQWLDSIQPLLSKTYREYYKSSLVKLKDFYETGEIRAEHNYKARLSYTLLHNPFKTALDEFISEQEKTLSPDTADNHKHSCARFLAFAQRSGAREFSDISYGLICHFDDVAAGSGKTVLSHLRTSLTLMMCFLHDRGDVPYGFTILTHYLSLGKGCFWNHVEMTVHDTVRRWMADTETVPLEKLKEYKLAVNRLHVENGYSKTARTVYNKAIDLLILFLDMNGYRYHPAIAMAWFENISHCFKGEAPSIRRALCLVAQYHTESEIRIEAVFRLKPRAFDLLPEWSREAAGRYLEIKTAEGWAQSTLNMIRSCICRFCGFLDRIGIRSFEEVEVCHIKQFNANDIHRTPAGKNAYNARLRRFLFYLGEKGYLGNPMLFISLARSSAPKETIVVVLTEEEMSQLNEGLHREESSLSLRKKAMLLLGLKMGMRSSDIVKIKIDDIDWNAASIRFVQDKTKVEVNLPMPTEVGNALFRYITEERCRKDSPNIFLGERAPHGPVGRNACNKALKTALPDRSVEGSGFHVTRKTFATELLRHGIGADTVADALGQRGTGSVHRYLSLDADRMRLCTLSLEKCGIGGWRDGK